LELHKRLGCSEDQANFNMLRESEEWEELEVPLSNMLRKANEREDCLENESSMNSDRE